MDAFWLCYGNYTGIRKIRPFLNYVRAKIKRDNKETAYFVYMCEGIRVLTQNTAQAFGGSQLTASIMKILDNKPETRSSGEIIEHMKDLLTKVGDA